MSRERKFRSQGKNSICKSPELMTTLISEMPLTRESDSPEEQLDKLHNIYLNRPLRSLRNSMATKMWQPGENGNSFKIVILPILYFIWKNAEGYRGLRRKKCLSNRILLVKCNFICKRKNESLGFPRSAIWEFLNAAEEMNVSSNDLYGSTVGWSHSQTHLVALAWLSLQASAIEVAGGQQENCWKSPQWVTDLLIFPPAVFEMKSQTLDSKADLLS